MFRGQIRNEIISFSLQHRKIGYLKRRLVEILIPCKTTGLKPFYNQFHQSTSGERRKRDIRGLSGFFVLLEATFNISNSSQPPGRTVNVAPLQVPLVSSSNLWPLSPRLCFLLGFSTSRVSFYFVSSSSHVSFPLPEFVIIESIIHKVFGLVGCSERPLLCEDVFCVCPCVRSVPPCCLWGFNHFASTPAPTVILHSD